VRREERDGVAGGAVVLIRRSAGPTAVRHVRRARPELAVESGVAQTVARGEPRDPVADDDAFGAWPGSGSLVWNLWLFDDGFRT
jgi:hypothetical protein